MGPLLQADNEALQHLSRELHDDGAALDAIATTEPVDDAYRFLAQRISTLATGVADTARLLDTAEREFTASLRGIQF